MENKTNNNSQLVFYILGFIVAIFFELYWMNNFPYDYFMLIGIGLILIITGYLAIDGILRVVKENTEARHEQNETMIKAQKAIYLATKKNTIKAESMQVQSLKAVNVLMDRMVDSIATKQLESSENNKTTDLSGLIASLTESNAKLAQEVQNAITVSELVKANENLLKNVQDVLGTSQKSEPVPEPVVETDTNAEDETLEAFPLEEISYEPEVYENESVEESKEESAEVINEDSSTIDIDDYTLEELDAMDIINEDISVVEAAVASFSDTIDAMEATEELENSMIGQD